MRFLAVAVMKVGIHVAELVDCMCTRGSGDHARARSHPPRRRIFDTVESLLRTSLRTRVTRTLPSASVLAMPPLHTQISRSGRTQWDLVCQMALPCVADFSAISPARHLYMAMDDGEDEDEETLLQLSSLRKQWALENSVFDPQNSVYFS